MVLWIDARKVMEIIAMVSLQINVKTYTKIQIRSGVVAVYNAEV